MNMTEAQLAVQPLINLQSAAKYKAQADKGLWVESNIMQPAGINSSINTNFGEALCNWIEDQLEVMEVAS